MNLTPNLRKFILTTHVTASVGWFGALAVFLAHSLTGFLSQEDYIVRAAALAMGITAWFVILPLSLASLTTGLVQALGTAWGLFRHYWVFFKLVLTVVATAVLLMKLGPISDLADKAAEISFSGADHTGLQTSMVIHAAGGLVILLAAIILAIYKPRGMSRYGVRKLQEQRGAAVSDQSRAVMPSWVKVIGAMVIILLLLMAIMLIAGGHGPASHYSHG